MKGFVVFCLTLGAVCAAPQYAYGPPNHHSHHQQSGSGISAGNTGFGASPLGNIGGGSIGNFGSNIGSQGSSIGGQQFSSGISQQSFGGFASNNIAAPESAPQQPIVTKQFFIHSAPEEQDEVGGDKVVNLGPVRKHYRVVFIKAPHQNIQGGKVRFVAPANEEKTVIYVLSKKTDLADIAADVQQAQPQPSKPEVHFIKYKTNEEAQHAQRTIQAQYDQLEGSSQVSDEGVAPVQSVIGVLGDAAASNDAGNNAAPISQGSDSLFTNGGSGSSSIGGSAPGSIDNGAAQYLPPSF